MLKRRVAAIAWRVGTGVSAETRLNEQAGSGGLIEFELAIQAGRCNRGRSKGRVGSSPTFGTKP